MHLYFIKYLIEYKIMNNKIENKDIDFYDLQ